MATKPNPIKDRIGELFPGDPYKALRHRLYSTPGVLEGAMPEEEVIDLAAKLIKELNGAPEIKASVLSLVQEPPPKEGKVLDPEEAAVRIREEAQELVTSAKPVIVKTPDDYTLAAQAFAEIKAMIKANEAKRVSITKPINESLRRINDEFGKTEDILTRELARYELPMKDYKIREMDALRAQEQERQRLIDEAQAKARADAEVARQKLEQAKAAVEEDPFLALLSGGSAIEEAREEVRSALVEVALAPSRIEMPDAVAPITAAGSRATFAWVAEIVDASKVDRSLCEPSTKAINAYTKLLKATIKDITKLDMNDPKLAGLRIKEDVRLSGR